MNLGPSVRLNEHFNASLNLQLNDVSLSTGSFVAKLLTAYVNYSFINRAVITKMTCLMAF